MKKIVVVGVLLSVLFFCACNFNRNGIDIELIYSVQPKTDNAKINEQVLRFVIESRLDFYGVSKRNMNIHAKHDTLTISLKNVDNPERIKKLIEKQGKLEFWETYEFEEIAQLLYDVNQKAGGIYYPQIKMK